MADNKNITIEDLSEIVNVQPRTIRKILRANVPAELQPGRGGRWIFSEKDLPKVKSIIESARKNATVIDLSSVEI